ncbi:MAG: hypothetical protein ACF8XB_23540 [Planctomycetota bacterium JB042]
MGTVVRFRASGVVLACVAAVSCLAALQGEPPVPPASLEFRRPSAVEPLAGPVTVEIRGEEIDVSAGVTVQVLRDGENITTGVVQGMTVVESADPDGDGRYETYRLQVDLDFSGQSVPIDTGVALHAFAEQQGMPFVRIASLGLVAPLTVGASPTVWVSPEHGTTVEYLVHLRGLTIGDWEWTLRFDGNDVTSSVQATESVVWDDTTEAGFTNDRLVKVAVDLDSIGFGTVGDSLTMEVAATQGTQVVTALSAALVETSEIDEDALIAQVKPCVEQFLIDAGASESGGKVTFSTPAADLEDAVRELGECLAETGLGGGKSVSFTVNGLYVVVGHKSAKGGDVTIAFGGANDHGNGEDAKATNGNPGGAAVAVGGDGEEGHAGGGTGGGDAAAETSGGGHSVAVGGNGGQNGQKGGNGGDATAKPNSPGPGAAFGGDGGNPGGSDEPGGGGGDAKLGGNSWEGGDGGTGEHGTGGWVAADSSGAFLGAPGQTKNNRGS